MDKVISKGYGKVLFLLITFAIYSCSSILSKLASMQEPLSIPYILCLIGVVIVLGFYAILWQKVLSFMPLNKAFLCKSITILMILVVSVLAFEETVTINNIIGSGFIIAGLGVLVWMK